MVSFEHLNDMCEWEQEKAFFLIKVAKEIGMNTIGYGELAVNENSGYTYLWLEIYNFCLYMPISCELVKTDVYALYTNLKNGEEFEMQLEKTTTLKDIEFWVIEQENKWRNEENDDG